MTNKTKTTLTGNKGEWSEFYAFIKILTDGKVFTADKNLKILEEHFHIVLKIIRQEAIGKKEYDISRNDGKVVVSDENAEIAIIDLEKIKGSVANVFEQIKNSKGTTFEVASAASPMHDLHCTQMRASSGKKADLTIVLHDKKSPEFPELGFSIKSMLGSPATLLNASGVTNFVYRIGTRDGVPVQNSDDMSVREATKLSYGAGAGLEFISMDNATFRKNLRKVDSIFPDIVAQMLKHYYMGNGTTIKDLVDKIAEDSDFMDHIDFTKDMLILNIKRFLSAIALGMIPSKDWDGYTEAHGGYIIVKEDGEVVCYHLYNRDKFEDYLFHNTKLDTPSTSRHGFGRIYEEDGEQRMKLNLQIRFLK
ncbi:MAG TPA: HpaII family restriction endonuclease [Bacteroidales bacterium]|nr:HpaII family restriction endonuclease [Bacteroidales bacterium]